MITTIQSFTDVITNSSSTVFIMHQADAKYYKKEHPSDIEIEKITIDWLRNNANEVEAIFKVLELDPSMITTREKGYFKDYWETPDQDAWESFLTMYEEKIKQAFSNLYWVDIEDHFENAYDVIDEARSDAKWGENRH